MLPGQLQQQYGNDPGYQNFLKWIAAGGKHGSYAGMMPNEAVVRVENTPWGENIAYDAAGNAISQYRAARPGEISPYQGPAGPSAPEYDPNNPAAAFIPDNIRAMLGMSPNGQSGGGHSMAGDRQDWSVIERLLGGGRPNPALPDGGLDMSQFDNFLAPSSGAPDPFQNSIAARFIERTQRGHSEQQQQMLREFIKRVMLAGQQNKQPVSPGLIAAAMGRAAV